jgi:hypothetical protein
MSISVLPDTTRRRLKNLQQIPSVWEGDRRPLTGLADSLDSDAKEGGECILWVDGSEGVVRAMDMVPAEAGTEAIVRALLRAMEHPHSPARPARPQKIVVRDREVQFFLRGVLQELDIAIDYVPELPLIDELFRGFEELAGTRQPKLPPQYAPLLEEKAAQMWQEAPWEVLEDHDILAIEINRWGVETLYASVLGMLGMEYGVLLYRSLESLKRFRQAVMAEESLEEMEQAFLGQDCLFITYGHLDAELEEDEDDEVFDLADLPVSEITPNFGIVHPFEGMRQVLYDEEAIAVYVALEALLRFFKAIYQKGEPDLTETISKRYRIPVPETTPKETISVTVSTLPELSSELLNLAQSAAENLENLFPSSETTLALRDDLVPDGCFLSLGFLNWEEVEIMRSRSRTHSQTQDFPESGDGLPILLIQASRPKAQEMIEKIQTDGGLKGIAFNPGADPFGGNSYDLGILQTENGQMYLFGEFLEDEQHIADRKQWEQRCQKTQGYCGLVIARGLKGASSGNPTQRDMMALFETRSLSTQELGLGMLQLLPQLSFESE